MVGEVEYLMMAHSIYLMPDVNLRIVSSIYLPANELTVKKYWIS